ncbi:hypothetical protein Daud_1123 [Candidatus Desulforudis audaxviator MP104C]|uniref:Uncharacterized protein n=1 Tax=Desulforudis audaxviator (strain MP104C) TaxID=477974 RepID=B1I3T3_DESAP|nr:hypothetical protein Daud_1123 [Candidatus Desulforudis audaxviator MP104C]
MRQQLGRDVACDSLRVSDRIGGRGLITIGFSPHRVEVLEHMAREMEGHDLILLEEPPDPVFQEMLAGRMKIEAYVEEMVPAFPEFTRHACLLLRGLYAAGKRIEQVEPYLERMERIYDLLDNQGVDPEQIREMPELGEVYLAEARATAALMNFYRKIGSGDFGVAVAACREFAHADAARLRLRARLRAEAIAAGARSGAYAGKVYVEAGYIHLAFFVFLRQQLAAGKEYSNPETYGRVHPRYLLEAALDEVGGPGAPRQLYSPGDVLTLRAVFRAPTSTEGEELLAARAIVYTALLSKKEKLPTARVPYPHLTEELRLLAHVRSLDYKACEAGFRKYLRKYTM